MKRIAFFTPRSITPLHPRLLQFYRYFEARGYQVSLVNESGYKPGLYTRLNWLSLYYFDLIAIKRCRKHIKDFDLVFVTDLRYLPLVKYAKNAGKKVIYETIDHNVYLRYYLLEKKLPAAAILKWFFVPLFKKIEKYYAFNYCDEILVNSEGLNDYFNHRARTLYYYSPFESLQGSNTAQHPPAMVYLGAFTPEKGANEIIELSGRLNVPLFVYGDVTDPGIEAAIRQSRNITYTSKVSSADLKEELIKLLNKHYLFGCSLIFPLHTSYEIQEANKDIDYLAMGIPIIGNYRVTTAEKIRAGCGLFFNDEKLELKMTDVAMRERMSSACKEYYARKYSSAIFDGQLETILHKYL